MSPERKRRRHVRATRWAFLLNGNRISRTEIAYEWDRKKGRFWWIDSKGFVVTKDPGLCRGIVFTRNAAIRACHESNIDPKDLF